MLLDALTLVLTAAVVVLASAWLIIRARRAAARSADPNWIPGDLDDEETLAARFRSWLKAQPRLRFNCEELGYNPRTASSVQRFRPIVIGTHCLFAKSSKLCGCKDWDPTLTLEENVKASLPAFGAFLKVALSTHYDGFVFEIVGREYGDTLEAFGDTVRRLLLTISDNDPEHSNCLHGDTLVTLASGTAMKIKDMAHLPEVLSLGDNNTFVPAASTAYMQQGRRKCVELLFSDGRKLVCTPEHRIRTTDGWCEARALVAGESCVLLGVEAPLCDPSEDDLANLAAFRLWTSTFVGARPVGPQEVYDISVRHTENFLANGITVHNCMRKSYVNKRGWCMEYARETLFITTFAPCFPSAHSRYGFGCSSSFVLVQPEFSFAWHNIGPDTPHTEWKNPKTVRDKIRVEYHKHGRDYEIPETIYYPPALHIVRPLKPTDPPIEWWKPRGEKNAEEGKRDK